MRVHGDWKERDMTEKSTKSRISVADIIEGLGKCLELVPTDPNFHQISVGLYEKDGVCSVWTFSQKEGAELRIERIRDQLVALGGLEPIAGSSNQCRFPCGVLHARPVRFLMSQAVGKAPDFAPPKGEMRIRDSKSALTLTATGRQSGDIYVYAVSGEGEEKNAAMRLRMVVAGFVKYGEMEKVGDSEVAFSCGQRHDELVRLLMPYSRNISSVESMMEAEAMRGQMTTGTLGFSVT